MYDSALTKEKIMVMLLKWAEKADPETVAGRFWVKKYATA